MPPAFSSIKTFLTKKTFYTKKILQKNFSIIVVFTKKISIVLSQNNFSQLITKKKSNCEKKSKTCKTTKKNCDQTQNFKCWPNSTTKTGTKLKNSNFDNNWWYVVGAAFCDLAMFLSWLWESDSFCIVILLYLPNYILFIYIG